MKRKKIVKMLVMMTVVALIAAFFILDLNQFITLQTIKEKQGEFLIFYQQNKFLVTTLFSFMYILVTALSLPVASLLTLLSGAIFGFINGLIIVSFASTIGASLAFLMSRFVFQEFVQKKYGQKLKRINEGFQREGSFYLFALRLVPVFPFFLVNLVTALLPIRLWTFYWISQLGMLPGTAVYIFAGTQLSQINSLSGILSPKILLAFALLGLFPIVTKKGLNKLRKRQRK